MIQRVACSLSLVVIAISCSNDAKMNAKASQPKNNIVLIDNGRHLQTYEKYSAIQSSNVIFKKRKPEPFVNEELPKSYTERLFLKKLAGSLYDIFLIPGNIVKYDTANKDYVRKTLVALIRNNKLPTTEVIQDGIIYSNKINKEAAFNGSFIIASLAVADKQIMELIVQDVTKSYVPDSLIDVDNVYSIINQIPQDQRKYYYYVKNAILTLINNRKYRESKIDANVTTTYVTAGGKVYNSNDKFARERVVTVELVSLEDLLKPNN